MALDRNATFTFQVHVIEYLLAGITFRNGICPLQQTIGKGRFPVVDVGNYAKITKVFHGCKDTKIVVLSEDGDRPMEIAFDGS